MIRKYREALLVIKNFDVVEMLKVVPNGIEHRASIYKTPDDFELTGSYEEDARYITPARGKLLGAFIDKILSDN